MVAELKALERKASGTRQMNKLRGAGKLPAVVYGAGKPGLSLTVEQHDFHKVLIAGERVVILKIDGLEDKQALIKDLQYDALGEHVLHVDFNELRAGQTVVVMVPLAVKGVAKGIAEGGVVNVQVHEIEVECQPVAIPDRITVDVSGLSLNSQLHVSEVTFPEGVTPITGANTVLVTCEPPRVEEAPAPAAEGATEPEVIGEKKPEPGEEGAEPAEKKPEKKEKEDKK
ncbi:MAG: 50S ribosomal protein L25 [Planctomycetota bacterium]|nr:50S ribosomal protein L25 [Planctomycetota bacterium]